MSATDHSRVFTEPVPSAWKTSVDDAASAGSASASGAPASETSSAGASPSDAPPSARQDMPVAGLQGKTGRLAMIRAALRHHRRWIVAIVLVVLAATLAAYLLVPRRFTAQADLWLDHGFERLGPATPTAAASNGPLARNTEIRLLTSSDLAAGVVDRLGLANVRGLGQPRRGALLPPAVARRQAIAEVRDNLRVQTNGASYAVAVRYTAADPVLAAGIVNHLVESYIADRRTGGARGRARVAMEAQLTGAREERIRNRALASGYQEAISLVRKGRDRNSIFAEIAALDGAIGAAVAQQTDAEARLREARGNAGAGPSGEITSPRIRQLRAAQADAAGSRTPGDGATAASRSGDIARELAGEVRRVSRLAENARIAGRNVELLRAARARTVGDLAAGDAAAAQLRQIGDRAAAADLRYADYAQRYAVMMAAQRRDQGTAYLISRGAARNARSLPDPLVFALGGLAAALLAVGAGVLLLEATTKGFRNRRQLERRLGLPVVGMVPDLGGVREADFAADDPMGPPDFLYNHRHSAFSTAFRGIHTGLRLGAGGTGLRSVAICSALAEEGKTTVAICLARSAALSGLRVVLVDCDARRPAASRALSPYVKTGLAHVLEDGADYRDVIQRDTPSGAWFLAQASERLAANGAVSSPAMTALVRELERDFDLVLLDMAPALALSESRELAAAADGVLLVARARRTPVEATMMARDLLEKAGARPVATTLTMVDS
ncbi:polysaccharide biosynthesis tyrosine autokinase [Sphingomonas solaris]|uniref:non-specific protein-tyrosine kinase n=1 Tax=Alterirhizorhabdus solaris TaxID=2529389 RepID=A0A558QSM7_9SPHN|nr:polysaccharide biosynthesis tyrosine autokinase [Sphingomonas solaris]TVV70151.1 AAA family ATPase [Sphingomonas solaris]